MSYEKIFDLVTKVDDFVWGPAMLVLLVGTGIFLTIRVGFLTWKNLGYAIKSTLSKEARTQKRGDGDVSPFSALTTALAATIGTGNIVGVATAMVSGGPGALVWMWISACFGLTSKFSECMLAIKYRERNEKGEMSGGPMYTMKKALPKGFGAVLGWLFALFAVLASFGIGNMTQANSISSALNETVGFSKVAIGVVLTILSLAVIVGGIKSISKVSSVVVPLMAVFYIIAGIIVIIGNIQNIPAGLVMIFKYAFTPQAVTGGVLGNVVASMMAAMQYGIARGCFSNEAGMGSAAITACRNNRSSCPPGLYQYDRYILGYNCCLLYHRSLHCKLRHAGSDRSCHRQSLYRFCLDHRRIQNRSWPSRRMACHHRHCTFCLFHDSRMGISW